MTKDRIDQEPNCLNHFGTRDRSVHHLLVQNLQVTTDDTAACTDYVQDAKNAEFQLSISAINVMTDDRQPDKRPITYSERELPFTFTKNETLKPETETHLHCYLMFLPCYCTRKMSVYQTIGLRENESA